MKGGTLELADGRRIAFDEYGAADGVPVLFCHGWPSSRSMAQLTDAAAHKLGLRIVSPDRPGINESSFQIGRTLLDWPAFAQALLAHLGIERVHLLAISGGAPYAYALAWAMPECVRTIAVISGAPPIAELDDHGSLLWIHRWMLAVQRRHPEFLRTMMHLARPFAAVKMPLRFRPFLLLALQRMDAEALRDSEAFESCFESSRRAWRASVKGVIADAEIFAQPWGFSLEEIQTPVRLWHGTNDRTFSIRLAEEIAQRLPNCVLKIIPDSGHYSLAIRHIEEILRDLISAGT